MRIRQRAEAIVDSLFARLLIRDDVLAALEAQPAADPEIQAACLKLAGTWTESAGECNNAGWALVRERGQSESSYQRGIRLAQAASRLDPNNGYCLNTLGVAQYRLGMMAAALATLTKSNELNRARQCFDLAFLAMAYQRLGKPAEAKAKLEQLRDLMRHAAGNISQSPENLAFLAEAEAVVLPDPGFPADPFAP
jgi:tetratricopeptide (TPR) repeat protein